MTNMKAAERAAELANAAPGSDGDWLVDHYLSPIATPDMRAFVQFIADADAAAREVDAVLAQNGFNPKGETRRTLSPFILPDDVDPLLIEARKLAAEDALATPFVGIHDDTGCWLHGQEASSAILAGNADKCPAVHGRLRALRRGMELAKEQGK